ncbi:hypothetical protein IH992_21550 [Candidatus Poribacteria bacterium]|nr:hypothetical protein [Candidatus Poribacteria bacterium]
MSLLFRFTRLCQHFHSMLESSGYFLLIVIGGLGCSQHQTIISPADLRAQLHPLKTIETYAGFDAANDLLYFGNRFVERQLYVNKDRKPVRTIGYVYKPSRQNYIPLPSEEFRFRVGEIEFSGNSELLRYDSYQIEQRPGGSRRILVQLTYLANTEDRPSTDSIPTDKAKNEANPIFHLQLQYEIYADLPVIRKWFTIRNLTDSAFFIEDIVIESLPFFAAEDANLQIWAPPSSILSIPWAGGASAEFMILREVMGGKGVVLGGAAPGVLKYYQIYSDQKTVSIGLTPTAALNGVEIRVPPKQSVSSPKVWTMLFEGDLHAIDKTISRMTGELSSASISSITWAQMNPTQHLPSADLIAVDYDWDSENFEVLKQVSQQVHNSGSKFGIRLPIAELATHFLDRPDWRLAPIAVSYEHVQSEQGKEENRVTYCVLSDYGYYLPQAIRILLEETSADLLIFDRPIISTPNSPLIGCNAYGHEHYSRAESIGLIYRWVFEFADYLHQEYPELQLGITSTAYGIEKPDSACLAHFDLFFHE